MVSLEGIVLATSISSQLLEFGNKNYTTAFLVESSMQKYNFYPLTPKLELKKTPSKVVPQNVCIRINIEHRNNNLIFLRPKTILWDIFGENNQKQETGWHLFYPSICEKITRTALAPLLPISVKRQITEFSNLIM